MYRGVQLLSSESTLTRINVEWYSQIMVKSYHVCPFLLCGGPDKLRLRLKTPLKF